MRISSFASEQCVCVQLQSQLKVWPSTSVIMAAQAPVGVMARHTRMSLQSLRHLENNIGHITVGQLRAGECLADIDYLIVDQNKTGVTMQALQDTSHKMAQMHQQLSVHLGAETPEMDSTFLDVVSKSDAMMQEVSVCAAAGVCYNDILRVALDYVPPDPANGVYCASEKIVREKYIRYRSSHAGRIGWMQCETPLSVQPWCSIEASGAFRLEEHGESQAHKDDSERKAVEWRRGMFSRLLCQCCTMGALSGEVRVFAG